MLSYKTIDKCIVLEKKDSDKNSYLCAYIICSNDTKIEDIRNYLSSLVPTYMIPSYFIKVNDIPLNSNGKVDRKKLLSLEYKNTENKEYAPPRNKFEEILKEVLEETLKVKNISIDDDIFTIGADSLKIMEILATIIDKEYPLTTQDFYVYKTIRNISDNLNNKRSVQDNSQDELYYSFNDYFSTDKIELDNILLTGATGFLGVHILNDLINNTKANIFCIVRNKDGIDAKSRFINKLEFYFGNKLTNYINKRIFIVIGDMTEDEFALTKEKYNELGKKINSVIHSAALVKHYGKLELFEKINIVGTKKIVEFCEEFNINLNYISTISVSGNSLTNQSKKDVIYDEKSLFVGQKYDENIYVKTKYLAEKYIYDEINSQKLTACIYRLGNITARYIDGVFQENDFENAFLNRIMSFIKLKMIPEELLSQEIDISPVDFCSSFIVQILQYHSSYNKVFHILNNNKIQVKELITYLNALGQDIKILKYEEFKKALVLLSRNKKNDMLGIINDLSKNYELMDNSIRIDTTFTTGYLSKLNSYWTKINIEYIEKFIKKYI